MEHDCKVVWTIPVICKDLIYMPVISIWQKMSE